MTESVKTRVARGAALLDQKNPGWWKHINLDTLDQEDAGSCVLAQTYGGSYHDGLVDCGMTWVSSDTGLGRFTHGFSNDGDGGGTYEEDTAEWERVILERRGEGPLADWEREILNGPAEAPAYSVAPEVVITNEDLARAKKVLEEFTQLSPTYAGDLTDTGVLFNVLDALGVLPLVQS